MKSLFHALAASACAALIASSALAAETKPATYGAAIAGLDARTGLLPTYLDRKTGHVLISLPSAGPDGVAAKFIYQVYLRASLGSTPVGLDRNQPGGTQILVFRRVGAKVYAEYENTDFPRRRRLAGGEGARSPTPSPSPRSGPATSRPRATDGAMLVDITSFLTRDAYGVAEALRRAKQGSFKLDSDLSHPDLAAALAFPENLEFEASQTFTADEPGEEVRGIAPDAHAITLTTHHSLIKLPPPGFETRLRRSALLHHRQARHQLRRAAGRPPRLPPRASVSAGEN